MPILPSPSVGDHPFADFVNFSFPADGSEDLARDLVPLISAAGAESLGDGLWGVGNRGTVRFGRRHSVRTLGISGDALRALRAAGSFSDLLFSVGLFPHRVTTLHATVDIRSDAVPLLRDVYRRAKAGQLALSRKVVSYVRHVKGPSLYGGPDTGTVYLSKRTSDVSATVYDKRQHLLQVMADGGAVPESCFLPGTRDPGPLTRFELKLGRHVGCSLRDVADPAPVFWHFAGDVLVSRPPDALPWAPAGEGYVLPPRGEREPWDQLKLMLARARDCESSELRVLAGLAHESGERAWELVSVLLRDLGAEVALAREGRQRVGLVAAPGASPAG